MITNFISIYSDRNENVMIYYQRNMFKIMYYTFTNYYSTEKLANNSFTDYLIFLKIRIYDDKKKNIKKHFTSVQKFRITINVFFMLVLLIICFIDCTQD